MATWMLVAAGIIDQYARNEAMRAGRFVRACRTFGCSFSVLGVVQIAAYGLLFGLVHGWLFDRLYPRVTADVAAAPAALFIRLSLYAAFGILLAACNLVFDYAKVWLVVEGRRSVLTAIRRTYEFVARHPAIVSGLYLLDTFTFVSLVAFYGAIAPDLGRGWLGWIAFALAQLFIVARIWVKLLFWASEIALFQNGFDGGVLLRSEQCSTIDRSD